MFEQATLASGPAGKRVLTTLLGLTSQVFLVGTAVLAPMVWPQVMPKTQLLTILPPVPQGTRPEEKKPPGQTATVRHTRPIRELATIYQPTKYPDKAILIEDLEQPEGPRVPGGTGVGSPTGVPGAPLLDIIIPNTRVPDPPKPPAKPPATAAPTPKTVERFAPGGMVRMGKLLHRVDPEYPVLAKATHVSGTVVLECVVGTDGRMLEVQYKSGNPLLMRAAVDAVRQWVYEPSQLNGKLIEILANITITFKLN